MKRRAIAPSLAVLFAANVARAQAPPVDLEWSAPPTCPGRDRVLDDVANMLRSPQAQRAPLRARATIVYEAGAYRADLVVDEGTRSLSADRCEALTEAVAFILALAIDPNAKLLGSSPSPAAAVAPAGSAPPDASTVPSPSPPTSPSSPTPAAPAPRSASPVAAPPLAASGPPFLHLAAEATLDTSTLPKPALGPLAAIGVRFGESLRAEAFGSLFFEQTTEASPSPIGAHVSGYVVGARAAYFFHAGELALGPSVGLATHVLAASAFGATTSRAGSATWMGAFVGAQATYAFHPMFAVRAEAHADLALARPEFVIENFQTVHRPGALSACAGFGVELRFF